MATVKTVNDEVWIQALVDGKRVNINESSIRRTPRLDDAEGTSCLTDIEIFEGLVKMSAKTTSWNEFSHTMASTIICLATCLKFNFSRYILLSLVKIIEAGLPFFMFPRFVQLVINHQLGDMAHHKEIFDNPSLTKKVFDNMKRVGTGFSKEVTPLFDNMLVQSLEEVERIKKLEGRLSRLKEENKVPKELKSAHSIDDAAELVMEKEKSSKQERKIANIDVLSMMDVNKEEPADVEEVLEVVKAAKLMTEVFTTAGATKVSVQRKRRGVIIQDPEETTTTTATVQLKVQAKDKGKAILVKEPKPLKRKVQIKLDEEVARQMQAELNADINWND
nr:hypothetical protein [Tanacetum cinerariifolium]